MTDIDGLEALRQQATAPVSMAELLRQSFQRNATRPCLVTDDRTLTYREIEEWVESIGTHLRLDLGLSAGDGIALLSPNRPEVVPIMLAALMFGYPYTGLHPLGSVADHAFVMEDSSARVLLYDGETQAERAAEIVRLSGVTRLIDIRDAVLRRHAANADAVAPPTANQIAWLVYTGGTTGKPKGVMMPHRSIVAHVLTMLAQCDWPDEIRYLAVTPLSHAAGMCMYSVIVKGGVVVTLGRPDPAGLADAVTRHRVNTMFLVPALIYRLLDDPAAAAADFSGVELILYGASAMSSERMRDALARFGRVFVQIYGQAEAPLTITVLRKEDHDLNRPQLLASAGLPPPGVEVRILGADDLPVPQGQSGEICCRGTVVMDGYWKRPEATADALRSGWLHTGDVGWQDEQGYVYIVDRVKDLIISGGFNVYPREVEEVLLTHPDVLQAAVIGVPDDTWGEAVTALVVRNGTVGADELRALVRERKGPLHAPKSVEFVDDLPLTAVGKPDKKALRTRYWAGQERQVH